jgi:hypothetical protein
MNFTNHLDAAGIRTDNHTLVRPRHEYTSPPLVGIGLFPHWSSRRRVLSSLSVGSLRHRVVGVGIVVAAVVALLVSLLALGATPRPAAGVLTAEHRP